MGFHVLFTFEFEKGCRVTSSPMTLLLDAVVADNMEPEGHHYTVSYARKASGGWWWVLK